MELGVHRKMMIAEDEMPGIKDGGDVTREGAPVLTVATLGLAVYGMYSIGLGAVDAFRSPGLDWWADAALVAFGLLLLMSAVLVRLRIPGGLALALSALSALQALALHNDMHFYGDILVTPQVVRGVIAAGLAALAYFGARAKRRSRAG
jgi:hypothetical protein